jgi:uncharacterized membrane-anchored protein
MTSARRRTAGLPSGGRHPASKVPEVTALFWITKVLTTAMGESTSDFLVHRMNPVTAVGLGALGLAVALALQFFRRTYSTWIYWLAVTMVAVSGTMAADVLHVRFGIPYPVTSTCFAVILAVIFIAWYASERTLSIHSIYTRRREVFYWATVMATFALGTAVGDLTAATAGLGYFTSAVVFAVLIAIPGVGYRWLGLNGIVAFWSAYVLTRPLGASLADWASVPHWRGGLGFGWGPVSLVLTVIITGMVGYLAASGKDAGPAATPAGPGAGHASPGPTRPSPVYAGQSHPGQSHPGQSHPGQSHSGQSHSGQSHSGRYYREQSYQEQAHRPPAPPLHPAPQHPGRQGRPARGGRHRAPRS